MFAGVESDAITGFAIGSSAPLVAALVIAATGVLRRWYRWRWGVWAAHVAFAVLWVSVGLPSTQSSTGAMHAWRTGLLWGLFSGAVIAVAWVLWTAATAKVPIERRGFEVTGRR